jgi:NAD(P)-dependent dehydrogenase (short-subunit alcohol dehydrogenase family)
MGIDWQGSRVLVTGASSGIGAGLAEQFAIRGAVVAVNGRDEGRLGASAELCRGHGATVHELPADLGDPAAVDRLATDAVTAMGGVDVLVNNAGIMMLGPIADSDDALFDRWRSTSKARSMASAKRRDASARADASSISRRASLACGSKPKGSTPRRRPRWRR